MTQLIEKTILINAPATRVWEHLTEPELIKKWMGDPELKIEIDTTWKVGSPIRICGFHHAFFENKGIILQFNPRKLLQYNQLNSVSRLPDTPENYTIITFQLRPAGTQTQLRLEITNFPTETIFKHLEFYWKTTPDIIKRQIETLE